MDWCDMAGRFRNSMRTGSNPHQMPEVAIATSPAGVELRYAFRGLPLLPASLTFPNSRWRDDGTSEVTLTDLAPLLPPAAERVPPVSGPLPRDRLIGTFGFLGPGQKPALHARTDMGHKPSPPSRELAPAPAAVPQPEARQTLHGFQLEQPECGLSPG